MDESDFVMAGCGSSRSAASRRTPSAPRSRSDPNAARGAERPFAAAVAMRIRGAFDVLVHVPSIVSAAQPYGQVLVQLHIPIRRVASGRALSADSRERTIAERTPGRRA